MVFLLVAGMAKYAAYQSSGQSASQIIAGFPKPILAILGGTGLDLATVSGFFGCLYLYILLVAGIHAAMIGAEVISKEERDKTIEFLIPKPVSRVRILTEKLLAALINVIILNIVTTVSSVLIVNYYNKGPSLTNDILVLMAGVLFVQLLFFAVGAFLAVIMKRPKAAASVATSILLGTYIISVFVDINSKLENLKYFTPFKYFDAKTLIANGKLDPIYVSISLVIIVILTVITYLTYVDRDFAI